MKKIIIAVIIALTAFLLSACLPFAMLAAMDRGTEASVTATAADQMESYGRKAEALDWLTTNKNEYAFAGNRFDDTAEAVDFVKDLYASGALKVWVTGIYDQSDMDESEKGPYADALIVELPKDTDKRDRLLGMYRLEVDVYGCNDGEEDSGYDGGDTLYFWWD